MQKDLLIVVLLTGLMVSISYGIMKKCPIDQSETVEVLTQRTMELEHEIHSLRVKLNAGSDKVAELEAQLNSCETEKLQGTAGE